MNYGYYGYSYNPISILLVLISLAVSAWASLKVRTTFAKYAKVRSYGGMTGAQAAKRILEANGIYDVAITHVAGNLTDHYNPSDRTLRLSDSVFSSDSVAAIGVAAHECGHAIQDQQSYQPLRMRSAFVPVANIGSRLAMPMILIGVLIGGSTSDLLIQLGILCFSLAVLFQIITLPVEFDASRRAMACLRDYGILYEEELSGTRKVLTAAALTYVAAALSAILQMVRLILIYGGRRRRD